MGTKAKVQIVNKGIGIFENVTTFSNLRMAKAKPFKLGQREDSLTD